MNTISLRRRAPTLLHDAATLKPQNSKTISPILFFGITCTWAASPGGERRVQCPATSTFPPRRPECLPPPTLTLSVSRLELHHLWKRQNKTNTTKQREVGVPPLSHLHALMRWRKGAEPGRVCSTPCSCLPASLSRPQSGGKPLLA